MHPHSMRTREEEDRELLVICDFIEARMISEAVHRKFSDYDFFAVDKSGGGSGLYVGSGLDERKYYIIQGYAMAMLDQLRHISRKAQS